MSDALSALRDLGADGRRGVHITPLHGGESTVLDANGAVLAGRPAPAGVHDAATAVLDAGVPRVVEVDGEGSWFVEPVLPAPRMLVFGGIAVADALVPMASAAGFAVEVIDPRPWLADGRRHPDAVAVHCAEPIDVYEDLHVDSGTAIVSFLHEPRLEDPVLRAALTGPAGYVGSMGSRRTTAAKRERLVDAGLEPASVERLHAPIGLDIGAVTPEEIAAAVLAEIVAVRRGVP